MKRVFAVLGVTLLLFVASCGGGGGVNPNPNPNPDVDKGSISGRFILNNLLPEDAVLKVVLLKDGATTPVAEQSPSADGDDWAYSFTDISYDSYYVRLTAGVDGKTIVLNQTDSITIDDLNPDRTSISTDAVGLDGTISGIVQVAGDFPTDRMVFVRVMRTDITVSQGPPDELNSVTFDVTEDLIEDGQFRYDIENTSYGIFQIELLGYDTQTHEIEVYGEYPENVVIDYLDHNLFSHNFGAGFGVDPPEVENGIIRGTVVFTGDPVWDYSIYASANTIPPVQGAPPGNFKIDEANYDAAGTPFEMKNLVYGEYSVSIYQYNFNIHKANYFGVYEENITISAENPVVEGIVVEADWSLLP
ncbi:hypothetical protein J7K50_09635 [bacterium]|nr:hypothetical protein [bacterium]